MASTTTRPRGPPGLISTYPAPSGLTFDCDNPLFACRHSVGGDNRYAYLMGTSMATPQVAAAAALVADLNPWLSVHDRLRLMKQTARRGGGWNPDLGWGILDAGAAISAARRIDRVAPSSRARARKRVRVRRGRRRAGCVFAGPAPDPARRAGLIPSGVRSYDLYMPAAAPLPASPQRDAATLGDPAPPARRLPLLRSRPRRLRQPRGGAPAAPTRGSWSSARRP